MQLLPYNVAFYRRKSGNHNKIQNEHGSNPKV
jgi:hypothetical protein